MSHHHHHSATESGPRLAFVVSLNLIITGAEIAGGVLSGSLSLLSDAVHNLSDAIAIVIAWIALRISAHPRTDQFTFGLKRTEVLAATVNAGSLVAISIFLLVASARKLVHPTPVAGEVMAAVATAGLVANILGTLFLRRSAKENLNLRAAYLHLFSDALSSLGVIAGGLAITFFGVTWVDPVLTIAIALYVLMASLAILWKSVGILLLRAPTNVSLKAVRNTLQDFVGIEEIHHVHLWEVSEDDIHLEAHVVIEDQDLSRTTRLRQTVETRFHDDFNINHATLQFEAIAEPCPTRASGLWQE